MLGRFCFQFAGGSQVWHQGQVNHHAVPSQFPSHLTDSFNEGQRFDVAYRSADLSDQEIIIALVCQQFDPVLDLIGDVGDHLDRFSEVFSLASLS